MLLGIGMLVLSIYPRAAFSVSNLLGFKSPSNLLLVACSVFLLLTVINLSTAISRLEEDRRRLVEEIALLDVRLRAIESEIQSKS
jgi:hypothetical protein